MNQETLLLEQHQQQQQQNLQQPPQVRTVLQQQQDEIEIQQLINVFTNPSSSKNFKVHKDDIKQSHLLVLLEGLDLSTPNFEIILFNVLNNIRPSQDTIQIIRAKVIQLINTPAVIKLSFLANKIAFSMKELIAFEFPNNFDDYFSLIDSLIVEQDVNRQRVGLNCLQYLIKDEVIKRRELRNEILTKLKVGNIFVSVQQQQLVVEILQVIVELIPTEDSIKEIVNFLTLNNSKLQHDWEYLELLDLIILSGKKLNVQIEISSIIGNIFQEISSYLSESDIDEEDLFFKYTSLVSDGLLLSNDFKMVEILLAIFTNCCRNISTSDSVKIHIIIKVLDTFIELFKQVAKSSVSIPITDLQTLYNQIFQLLLNMNLKNSPDKQASFEIDSVSKLKSLVANILKLMMNEQSIIAMLNEIGNSFFAIFNSGLKATSSEYFDHITLIFSTIMSNLGTGELFSAILYNLFALFLNYRVEVSDPAPVILKYLDCCCCFFQYLKTFSDVPSCCMILLERFFSFFNSDLYCITVRRRSCACLIRMCCLSDLMWNIYDEIDGECKKYPLEKALLIEFRVNLISRYSGVDQNSVIETRLNSLYFDMMTGFNLERDRSDLKKIQFIINTFRNCHSRIQSALESNPEKLVLRNSLFYSNVSLFTNLVYELLTSAAALVVSPTTKGSDEKDLNSLLSNCFLLLSSCGQLISDAQFVEIVGYNANYSNTVLKSLFLFIKCFIAKKSTASIEVLINLMAFMNKRLEMEWNNFEMVDRNEDVEQQFEVELVEMTIGWNDLVCYLFLNNPSHPNEASSPDGTSTSSLAGIYKFSQLKTLNDFGAFNDHVKNLLSNLSHLEILLNHLIFTICNPSIRVKKIKTEYVRVMAKISPFILSIYGNIPNVVEYFCNFVFGGLIRNVLFVDENISSSGDNDTTRRQESVSYVVVRNGVATFDDFVDLIVSLICDLFLFCSLLGSPICIEILTNVVQAVVIDSGKSVENKELLECVGEIVKQMENIHQFQNNTGKSGSVLHEFKKKFRETIRDLIILKKNYKVSKVRAGNEHIVKLKQGDILDYSGDEAFQDLFKKNSQ